MQHKIRMQLQFEKNCNFKKNDGNFYKRYLISIVLD